LALDETVVGTIDAARPTVTYRVSIPAGTELDAIEFVPVADLVASFEVSTQFDQSTYTSPLSPDDIDELSSIWYGFEFFEDEEWLLTVTGLDGTSGSYEIGVSTLP
jgi:hypothetical protein